GYRISSSGENAVVVVAVHLDAVLILERFNGQGETLERTGNIIQFLNRGNASVRQDEPSFLVAVLHVEDKRLIRQLSTGLFNGNEGAGAGGSSGNRHVRVAKSDLLNVTVVHLIQRESKVRAVLSLKLSDDIAGPVLDSLNVSLATGRKAVLRHQAERKNRSVDRGGCVNRQGRGSRTRIDTTGAIRFTGRDLLDRVSRH